MSHELRTPLNAILGYTQLFSLEGGLTPTQRENVREIHRAGEYLLQLISDVLDLSKIESGRMTLSVEPVVPMRIVSECIKLIQPLVDSRQVRLWATTNGLDDICVRADATRLKQALLNLMANAVKYNHLGGDVEVIFTHDDDGIFRIEVRDNGPGIPESRQAEMFEPFNRLGAEGSATEGSGVGLVITKRLVNMMGGELTFRSREGHGSRFWITLPDVMPAPVVSSSPQPLVLAPSAAQALQVGARKRILYIEDNPPNIRLMEQMLKNFARLELISAKEAFYGVYLARTERPDLIILDINLPGMDGYEALSVLKQDRSTRDIPVVALSANAMPYDVMRGQEAGFDEYLTKPLDLDKLLGTLNHLLLPVAE
jgi:CheY-like chemotaxis protein